MHLVTFNENRFHVSQDPDKLIGDFLTLALSDYYINQVESLFTDSGEGIDDIYGDVNIYAFRAMHADDLPEYISNSEQLNVPSNEIWVISASGFCYEAESVIIPGDELRQIIQFAKKLKGDSY
ncbi:MAG: hypothetical protein KME64_42565 [Scytonematopsis contorta HA4267-MV1]|jgi:hypothetical protein|nr:hypothetical protein [Scytonematopsis contorta HA4267-MV1]